MIRQSGLIFLIAAALSIASPATAQTAATPAPQQPASTNTSGTVVDISGAVIPGAEVVVTSRDGRTATVKTDSDGRFDAGMMAARVRVSSEGFETSNVEISGTGPVQIVLRPTNFADSVVVTATRGAERLPSAASSTVLTSAELSNMAAGALDDALRATPGFTLFRRSSSRVANPTTQGVTLRGVSGSGSSRTLVLADGVPLNDPFGSWVYWNRIPMAAVDKVEVVRGATGDLYGAGALGGVVQLLTVQPSRTRARATIDGGSHDTFRGSLFMAGEKNGWNASGAYEGVTTAGVYVLASEVRGAVDTRADSDYRTGFGTVGYHGGNWHFTGRGAGYTEDRNNGTLVQVNSTDWKQFSAEAGGYVGGGVLELHAGGSTQDYYQTFSAVTAGNATTGLRPAERLTFEQFIDTDSTFANGQYTKLFGKVTIIAGGDLRHTDGSEDEIPYALVSGVNTRRDTLFSGGIETVAAGYGRLNIAVSDAWTVEVGARGDHWTSDPQDASLPTKESNFLSPRAAVSGRLGRVQVQASTYYANRTPSLNELFRRFAVGNQETRANSQLNPETLTGVEGGVLTQFARASVRATAFLNTLDGAISNITLSQTSAGIIRERRNADKIEAKGLEVEVDSRFTNTLSASGQVVFTSSHFRASPRTSETPALIDKFVPQVPKVQGAVALTWADPKIVTVGTQLRFSGQQFDDDLNTPAFILQKYVVWDATVSRAVVRGLNAFLAVENITDKEYDTARTPLRSIGWPRTVRVGARITWQ